MYDDATTAWNYTKSREIETKRGIDKEGFLKACEHIPRNINEALVRFGNSEAFRLSVVLQKKLRDKQYMVVSDKNDIDTIIKQGYNIDNLRNSL